MPLMILGYLVVFAASLFWGRRLYGGWTPAIALALVSPVPFMFLVPLINLVFLFFVFRLVRLLGFLNISLDNEWMQGAGTLFAAIVCSLALRHFAKTEGVKQAPAQPPAPSREDGI